MIRYATGNILHSDAEALVNTVNCVGVMGRGVALQFKNSFPDNFKAYARACARKEVQPGRMFVFETGYLGNPKYIVNFPTKRHWRGKSRIEDIDSGLQALVAEIRERRIRSVALPPLGSGLGGLDWRVVRPRIDEALRPLDQVEVTVFEPSASTSSVAVPRDTPSMTAGRAALIGLISEYLRGLLDPFVTLLEVHKLMYFMQESGEPLKLRYVKAPYGPYAENLRHVLREVEGYFVSGYADDGDLPDRELSLVPGAVEDASAFIAEHPETQRRFDRVTKLVQGFETPFGLELLSTVHWVVKHSGVARSSVVAATYGWNDRKRQFTPEQIDLALTTLDTNGWFLSSPPEVH